MSDLKQTGRTFFDYVHEHPKIAGCALIFLLISSLVLSYFGFIVKTPLGSIEKQLSTTASPDTNLNSNMVNPNSKLIETLALKGTHVERKSFTKPKSLLSLSHVASDKPGPSIKVESNNQSGGQTAYEINNFTPQPRHLDNSLKHELLQLPLNKKIMVGYDITVQDGVSFGREIYDYLASAGYKVHNEIRPMSPDRAYHSIRFVPGDNGLGDILVIIGLP